MPYYKRVRYTLRIPSQFIIIQWIGIHLTLSERKESVPATALPQGIAQYHGLKDAYDLEGMHAGHSFRQY